MKTGSNTRYNTYSANFSDTYGYDGVNNRTYRNNPYGPMTQNYDADDEMTGGSDGYARYTYDADGEQATSTMGGQATTYGWDFDGDMTSITRGGSSSSSFQYDALGRLVYRVSGGVTTNLIYDGDRVVQEWQGGTRTGAYVWGAAGLVRHNGEYPLSDAQGNTRVVADAGGNPTCFLNADASGIEWGSGGGTSDPYAWGGASGYRMDGDGPAGGNPYYKVGWRFYDQDYARFLSRDTDLSQSPYAYCDGDPVNFNDPSGHSKVSKWLKKLLAGLAAAATIGTGAFNPGGLGQPTGEGWEDHKAKPGAGQPNKTPSSGSSFSAGNTIAGGTLAIGLGYGLYEGLKWTAATLAAPETGGLSLAAAALAP